MHLEEGQVWDFLLIPSSKGPSCTSASTIAASSCCRVRASGLQDSQPLLLLFCIWTPLQLPDSCELHCQVPFLTRLFTEGLPCAR